MEEEAYIDSSPPRDGEILFAPGAEAFTNACISHGFSDITYPEGYRRAALFLANHVCNTGREQDFLVYPIVYLYRHNLELCLKSIISSACYLLDKTLSDQEARPLRGHSLLHLWHLAMPMLNAVCARVPNEHFPSDDLAGIDSYIRQLHNHDPDGQRFRYSTTIGRGKAATTPSLRRELTNINIRKFADCMERLANYIEGIDTWFSDLTDAKCQALHANELSRT